MTHALGCTDGHEDPRAPAYGGVPTLAVDVVLTVAVDLVHPVAVELTSAIGAAA